MFRRYTNITLLVIGFFLAVMFITSAVLSYTSKVSLKNELFVQYAERFLTEKQYALLGKELDCSGFTKNIFAQYNIHIPASAAQQYTACDTQITAIEPTDLVFFRINNSDINHVGMIVYDSVFIHSPGKGKIVRLDSLQNSYWRKYYFGNGRVEKNK